MKSLREQLTTAINGMHEATLRNSPAALAALNDHMEGLLARVEALEVKSAETPEQKEPA